MKKLLSLSVVSLISSSMAFLFLPVISGLLSLESFAEYSFLYSLSAVLTSVCMFGSTSSYSLAIAENDHNYASQVIRQFLTVNVIFSCIIFTIICVVIYVNGWSLFLLGIPLLIVGKSLFILTSHFFRVHKEIKKFAAYQLLTWALVFIIPICLIYYSVIFSGIAFIVAMGSVMFSSGVIGIYLFNNKGYIPSIFINLKNVTFFRFGLFAALHSLVAALITIADRFILISFVEKKEFAVYALAATLSGALTLIYTVLNQNLAPDFYAKMKEKNNDEKVLYKYFSFYFCALITIFVIYQVSIEHIVSIFFSKAYLTAIPIAKLLAIGALIQGVYFFGSSFMMYLERSSYLFFTTLICGFSSVLGGIVSYFLLGMIGVVYSYIVVWLLYSLATFSLCFKEYKRLKN